MRRRAPLSNDGMAVTALLRRVASGVLILRSNRLTPAGRAVVEYNYEDGVKLPIGVKEGTIERLIARGALIPVKGETLYGDETAPQCYRLRTPADGQP